MISMLTACSQVAYQQVAAINMARRQNQYSCITSGEAIIGGVYLIIIITLW